MTFDTIILGAGTAGCVVAARLSQSSDERVLLVEAGHNAEQHIAELNTLGNLPAHSDWRTYGVPTGTPHHLWLPRGRAVGGTSLLHGGIALHGFPSDFAHWAAVGGERWAYEAVLPIFRQMERDPLGGPWHGKSGPIPIFRADPSMQQPFHAAFVDGCAALGFGRCDDFNAPPGHGVGPPPLAGTPTSRANVRSTYLAPRGETPNLTLRAHAIAWRLHLKAQRVTSVEIVHDGRVECISAGRVVLACGAVGTPELMLRSGLGPEEDLRPMGVPIRMPLPGVGKSLRDHPCLWIALELGQGLGEPNRPWFQAMLREPGNPGNGMPAATVEAFHDFRLAPSPKAYRRGVITLSLLAPRRVGQVRLDPGNPESQALVMLGHLGPDDRSDLIRLLRFADALLVTPSLREMGSRQPRLLSIRSHGGFSAIPIPYSFAWNDRDPATIDACVTTAHHLHGTCRMGPVNDPGSVVDAACKVHGIENLFIADASVIPVQFQANTHLVTVMIAEAVARHLAAPAP